MKADGSALRPVPGRWVTLHRVGRDSSGPVDSVRSSTSGAFSIRYRPFGDTTALYFAASQYGGVAYYAIPEHGTGAPSAPVGGDITVYDTTSRADAVAVESRHIIVAAPDTGASRTVIEVFVLSNAGDRTLVAGATGRSTFEVALPAGAFAPQSAEGDVSPEAMSFASGIVRVTAPIAPGTRRVAFSYRVPVAAHVRPAPGRSALVEILVEDTAAVVQGAGVREGAPTTMSGRLYRRFTGREVSDAGSVVIIAPTGTASPGLSLSTWLALVAAGAMVVALSAALRRGRALAPAPDAP